MSEGVVVFGTCILLGIIFIIGGVVMLKSKMTPEKEALNQKLGGTYFGAANKVHAWLLIFLGVFWVLGISAIMIRDLF